MLFLTAVTALVSFICKASRDVNAILCAVCQWKLSSYHSIKQYYQDKRHLLYEHCEMALRCSHLASLFSFFSACVWKNLCVVVRPRGCCQLCYDWRTSQNSHLKAGPNSHRLLLYNIPTLILFPSCILSAYNNLSRIDLWTMLGACSGLQALLDQSFHSSAFPFSSAVHIV
jgi:hypothetical protein